MREDHVSICEIPEDLTQADNAGGCEPDPLDDDLRRSVSINSAPIRSGIGLKDIIDFVREGVASKRAEEEKRSSDSQDLKASR